jgi:hypothetical protein
VKFGKLIENRYFSMVIDFRTVQVSPTLRQITQAAAKSRVHLPQVITPRYPLRLMKLRGLLLIRRSEA